MLKVMGAGLAFMCLCIELFLAGDTLYMKVVV